MTMDSRVQDNADKGRFELDKNGQIAFANYRRQGTVLVIHHVEAPIPLRGTGAAGELMRGVAEIARAEGRKVAPLCGYAFAWMRRHKEYHDLIT